LELIECLAVGENESRSWGGMCGQAGKTSRGICFKKFARLDFGK